MKFKVKKLQQCKRIFEIEVSKEEVEQKLKEVYEDIRKTAQIPGFRVGKAPEELLRKHYQKTAREEVLKRLIPGAYQKALKESELVPIGLPEISDVKMELEDMLTFAAAFEIKPTIGLKNYKGIKIKKNLKKISDEDVEKVLKYLQEVNAEFSNVEDRGVAIGDYIICDIEAVIDSKPQEQKKNIWFFVDDKFKIKGFCDQLIGTKAGDTKDLGVTLPEDYPVKEFSNKKAVFKVKISQIKVKKLREINDDFAKHLGKFQDLSELKSGVRKDLEASAQQDAKYDMENQLLEQLVKDSTFDIPNSLVEAQTKRLLEHAKHDLKHKGFTDEQISSKEKELLENLKKDAARQVRIYFILDEVANKEDVKVTQPEIEKGISDFAQRSHKNPQEVKEYLQEKDIFDDFVAELREEKTIEFLLQNAIIVE